MNTRGGDGPSVTTILDIFPDSRAPVGGLTVRVIHRDPALGNLEVEFAASKATLRAAAQFILRRLRESPDAAPVSAATAVRNEHDQKNYRDEVYRTKGR